MNAIGRALDLFPPYVVDERGSRSLHFSHTAIQSRMDHAQPDALMLEYTQLMMGFLLFQPQPRNLAMIGLGGGSLAKFCYSNMPQTRVVAVEINPRVIALRDEFLIPPDGARFKVIEGDGALYVRCPPKKIEVLLVDGFDASGMPQQLCSQRFYDNCYDALHPGGMLVVNFHAEHPLFHTYLDRVRATFLERGSVLVVRDIDNANAVVFACKGNAMHYPEKDLAKPNGFSDTAWGQLRQAFEAIASQIGKTTR